MELPPDFRLKAGRGDGSMPADPQLQLAMTSVLCCFVEAAMRDAAAYCAAAGRTRVTARDVCLGMKAQAVPSGAFWERPDLASEFGAHRAGLLEEMARGDDSDDDSDAGEEEDEEEDEEAEEQWTRAPEGDALVDRLHAAEAEFASWTPTEPLELAVRNAILRAGQEAT